MGETDDGLRRYGDDRHRVGNDGLLPPEGAVLAFIGRWGGSFGTLRSSADCFLVAAAILLSFYFFGELRGIREGTVIAALGGGNVAKYVISGWNKLLPKIRATDK